MHVVLNCQLGLVLRVGHAVNQVSLNVCVVKARANESKAAEE
jgi:hypothetical protein